MFELKPFIELPNKLWEQVFDYLLDEPQTLILLSRCSTVFQSILMEHRFKAAILVHLHSPTTAAARILSVKPHSLDFELAVCLVEAGMLFPKFLIELTHFNTLAGITQLPAGTMEYMIACGYKTYGDSLLLDSFGMDDETHSSDLMLLKRALDANPVEMDAVRLTVDKHYFVPSLASDEDRLSIVRLLWKLADVSPSHFTHLLQNAGKDMEDVVVESALLSKSCSIATLVSLASLGLNISNAVLVSVLKNPRIDSTGFKSTLEIIRNHCSEERLEDVLQDVLSGLFMENTREAIRIADFLLVFFQTSEQTLCNALMAYIPQIRTMKHKRGYILPMTTSLGVLKGGMNDCLWPMLASRVGADHLFVECCLMDMLTGGVIASTATTLRHTPPAQQRQNSIVKQLSSTSSSIIAMLPWKSSAMHDLDPETENSTRDSLTAMFEAGVPIKPTSWPSVSYIILSTRKVPPRLLEYLVCLEKTLLQKACQPESIEYVTTWVATINTEVISNITWTDLIQTDSRSSSLSASLPQSATAILTSVSETMRKIDTRWRDVKRVYYILADLVSILQEGDLMSHIETEQQQEEDIDVQQSSRKSNLTVKIKNHQKHRSALLNGGQFQQWLEEVEGAGQVAVDSSNKSSGNSATSVLSAAAANVFSGWFK